MALPPLRCISRSSFSGGGTPSRTPTGVAPQRARLMQRSKTTLRTAPSSLKPASRSAGCVVACTAHTERSIATTVPSSAAEMEPSSPLAALSVCAAPAPPASITTPQKPEMVMAAARGALAARWRRADAAAVMWRAASAGGGGARRKSKCPVSKECCTRAEVRRRRAAAHSARTGARSDLGVGDRHNQGQTFRDEKRRLFHALASCGCSQRCQSMTATRAWRFASQCALIRASRRGVGDTP